MSFNEHAFGKDSENKEEGMIRTKRGILFFGNIDL